ncbi:MAG: beta-ketoacyl-ACP synthase III [Gemmatimonadota bacterium]
MKSPTPIVRIAATGRYLPERVVTNDDLSKLVETSDEWIRERTGIAERRIAPEAMLAAEMGELAARQALERAGVAPGEVDVLIVTTATPDRWLPSTACDLQSLLGASNAFAYDLSAACTGFLYGVSMGEGFLAAGRGDVALVVSTEKMSAIVDWTDRSTCVLFGDGAGAAVLRRSEDERGILSSHHGSDGALAELLYRPAGGVRQALDLEALERKDHMLKMHGREVFKNAVRNMAEASEIALQKAGLTAADVDLMVPHQANIRIIEATARYAGIPMDKVFVNVDRYGNMSSATVPVALDEAQEQGRLGPGAIVLSAAFGAGLTWGAMTFRW